MIREWNYRNGENSGETRLQRERTIVNKILIRFSAATKGKLGENFLGMGGEMKVSREEEATMKPREELYPNNNQENDAGSGQR